MNTSLMNARIFDDVDSEEDDLWNEVSIKPKIEQPQDVKPTIKTEIKKELFDEETNFSINTDDFAKIEIKKEVLDEITSPMKTEETPRKSLKSAKITLYKKRDSPYKSALERLGPPVQRLRIEDDTGCENKRTRKSRKEPETDPEILSRRQKQIDYGKNTVGYDEYSRRVPKNKRKDDDPQTPNKFVKYSRRGWDGLVKQWRLRLHKYDPEGAA